MIKQPLFIAQFAVLFTTATIHVTALKFFLYWYFVWLDVIVHFLGGVWVALFIIWFLSVRGIKIPSATAVMGLVIAVGVGWEIFEVLAGIPREHNFIFDTSIDLLMDATGAIVGIYVADRLIEKRDI